MRAAEFLSSVLPATGIRFVTLLWPDGKPAQKEFYPYELDNMVSFALWGDGKGASAYFSVGGFRLGADGVARRTTALSELHRCLRLDIDCGPGKPYPGKREALTALGGFCHAYALPNPTVVDSGGGLHCYFLLDQDIPVADWLALSARLAAACTASGLQVDPTVTCDAARILRLPETHNYKGGDKRPVRVLATGTAASPSVYGQQLPSLTATPLLGLGAVPAALAAVRDDALSAGTYRDYFLRDVVRQCPGILAMGHAGGAGVQEPLWKVALDLVNKSGDTPNAKLHFARLLSSKHPGFDETAFQTKWQQVQAQDYHPPTCSKFSQLGMKECAKCPLRGTIPSPASIRPAPTPVPVAALQTATPVQHGCFVFNGYGPVAIVPGALDGTPFVIGQDHRPYFREVKKEEGKPDTEILRRFFNYPLVSVDRLQDESDSASISAITFKRPNDGTVTVSFCSGDFADARKFSALMGSAMMYGHAKDYDLFRGHFMTSFLQSLQHSRAANKIASHCGWTPDKSAFVLGSKIYTANGTKDIRASGGIEMDAFCSGGDESKWREAFDVTMRAGPERQAILALSIASPLMAFVGGLDGVVVNAYSQHSGSGKSTACDAALSVWGSPHKARRGFHDTVNSLFKVAVVFGNLPLVLDETTNVDGKLLSDFIYTVTQGREKTRLSSDIKLHSSSDRWCLPVITSSNSSILEKLLSYKSSATAEAARCFEIEFPAIPFDKETLSEAKARLANIHNNFGFLGPRVLQLLLAKDPTYWTRVVKNVGKKWDMEVSTGASDRFRSAACALIEVGCEIGKALGLAFDTPAVTAMLKVQWAVQLTEFASALRSPTDFAKDYIEENLAQFFVIGGSDDTTPLTRLDPSSFAGEMRCKRIGTTDVVQSVVIPLGRLKKYIQSVRGSNKEALRLFEAQCRARTGAVLEIGEMMFLLGHPRRIRTPCVKFSGSIVGSASLSAVDDIIDVRAGRV